MEIEEIKKSLEEVLEESIEIGDTYIYLQGHQIEDLIQRGYNEEEGWTIDCDEDEGEFDSEKGAMTNYPVYLMYEGELMYEARGGYYTSITSHRMNGLTFRESKEDPLVSLTLEEFKDTLIRKEGLRLYLKDGSIYDMQGLW